MSLTFQGPFTFAKLVPRLCDVPACSARLSPIIASIVYVQFAPAKKSIFSEPQRRIRAPTVPTRKGLDARLAPGHHRHSCYVGRKVCVHVHHAHGLLLGLLGRGVSGVALLLGERGHSSQTRIITCTARSAFQFAPDHSDLPQELERPHKRPRAHLPPVHVAPLVDEQREVAVALHPPVQGRMGDVNRGRDR